MKLIHYIGDPMCIIDSLHAAKRRNSCQGFSRGRECVGVGDMSDMLCNA